MNIRAAVFNNKIWQIFHLLVFVCFTCGIIFAKVYPNIAVYVFPFLVVCGVLVWAHISNARVLFFCAFFVALTALGALSFSLKQAGKERLIFNQTVIADFTVVSFPKESGNRNILKVILTAVNGGKVSEKFTVYDYSGKLEYLGEYSGKVILKKQFFKGRSFYSFWLKRLTVMEKLPSSMTGNYRKYIVSNGVNFFRKNYSHAASAFFLAIILGRKEFLGDIRRDFGQAGLAHLLAISGLHIGVVTGIVFFFLRLLNLPFRICLVLSSILLGVYVLLTGMNPSTVRAFVMWFTFAIGFIARRKVSVWNSLGLAGFILVLFNSSIVFDLGFQLSFISVFFLILAFNLIHFKKYVLSFRGFVRNLFLASVWVNIGILPIISYHFGKIYLLSILTNIFFIPWFSMTLILGVLSVLFSPLRVLAEMSANLICCTVNIISKWHYSYISYRCNSVEIFIYYITLTIILSFVIYSRQKVNRK